MPFFTDQTGRTIFLPDHPPNRIVSLVPSQTELLFDLGLDEQVVGITKFCVHPPEWFYTKARVGGTKKLNTAILHQLEPDLIIANKEENVKEQIEELAERYPVWISDVATLDDAYEMIAQVGALTRKMQEATSLLNRIKTGFTDLQSFRNEAPERSWRSAYLIWNDPYMTTGHDTFIHAMLQAAGFQNVFADRHRYPEVTPDDIRNSSCELLLLSSEPYPFKQIHIDQLQPLLPHTKIILVDGQLFSWYGSRLLHAPAYLKSLVSSLRFDV